MKHGGAIVERNLSFRQRALEGYRIFRHRRVTEAIVLALSIVLPITVLGIGLGMWLRYSPVGGWLVPGLAVLGLGVGFAWAWRYGQRHRLTYPQFLRHLERRLELGRNELVNADELEAGLGAIDDPLTRGLAAGAVGEGATSISRVPFRSLAPARNLRRPALQGLGAAVLAALLFVAAPDAFRSALGRFAAPGSFDLPPEIAIQVSPGDVTVPRGQSVAVRAELPAAQEDAQLFWRATGGAWRSLEMIPTPDEASAQTAVFAWNLNSVAETIEYAVASGSNRTRTYRVEVTEPLRATGYRKQITPPAYTGLRPVQETSLDGNISVVAGSQVSLQIETSRDDARGTLLFGDGETLALDMVGGTHLAATLNVRESREYRVALESPTLDSGWTSPKYRLEAVADRHPTLYQLAPEKASSLSPEMIVEIDVDCLDDFGLSRLDLVYQRNDQSAQRETLARWNGEPEARVVHPWDLEGIALTPGDIVRFHLELTDNDAITGPKVTKGPLCEVRFPTLEEMYAEVEEDRDGQMSDVSELRAHQEDLRKDLEDALNDLRQDKDLKWEQQEQLKDLAQRQEKVSNQIEDLAKSIDRSLEQMQQAELFSPELLQKVQEISQLVRQIQSPNFQKYMDQLKSAVENLDKRAIEKTLEEMQTSQEDMARSLDRTLELLKRLQTEEQFDELLQQAERLLEQQQELNRKLAANQPPQDQDPSEQPQDAQDQGETPQDPQAADAESQKSEPNDPQSADEENSAPASGEENKEPQSADQQNAEQQSGEQQSAEQQKSEQQNSEQQSGEQQRSEQQSSQQQAQNQQNQDSQQQSGQEQEKEQASEQLTPEEVEQLKEMQEELRKQLEKLQEALAELQKQAEENWEELKEQLEQQQAEKQLEQANDQMQQSAQSMPQSQKESLKFGRQAEQQLQQFAQQMRSAQQEMQSEEQEDISKELFSISNRLVRLSNNQEYLLKDAPSRATRDLAARQSRLTDAARSTLDELFALGRRTQFISPELGRVMGETVRNLQESTHAFEQGNRQGAMTQGQSSTSALNATVVELLETGQQMQQACQSAGSCNNPMGKMRSLSSAQEKLNGQMQQMLSQGSQTTRLQQQGTRQQQLLEMAARQQMIRQGLQEVQQAMGERQDVLGRLDDISKEMEEVEQDMRNRDVDSRILERQQRILSRLLTAQKSIRREDHKDERMSRTGQNPLDRTSPAALQQQMTREELLRRGILRGSQDPVPDEYRGMVEEYFESLSEQP